MSIRTNQLWGIKMERKISMRDFLTGTIGGTTGILLSHPFDTAKTIYQSTGRKGLRNALNSRNLAGRFYRGVVPPLLGSVFEKSLVFGVHGNLHRFLQREKPHRRYRNHFIAGYLAGVTCCVVVTPVERLKIKMQNGALLRRMLYTNENLFRYLYRGYLATTLREGMGFGIYFTVYHYLRGETPPDNLLYSLLYGGATGMIAWTIIFPIDLVKTIQQQTDRTLRQSAQSIYQTYGLAGFYRGLPFSLMRAIPLHAGVFLGAEAVRR